MANGKYLYFLDSDDVISSDCIERLYNIAHETQAQMTASQIECEQLTSGNKSFCLGRIKDLKPIEGNDAVLKAFVNGKIASSAVNKLFDVAYLRQEKLYFIPGLFAQDELWTFHSVLKMNKVAFQKEVTYTYYLHGDSVIHNRGKKNFDNWQTIGIYIDKELKKEEEDPIRRNLILTYLVKYKNTTLLMNWRAQKNEQLWKESYSNYKTLSSLSFTDYFSNTFSKEIKKMSFFNSLPTSLGFKLFQWRWK